jgi:bacteriorhodopsin
MTLSNQVAQPHDTQRTAHTPVSPEAAPHVRRSSWNPAWGWAVFALVVLVAMVIAFVFGGNQDYS